MTRVWIVVLGAFLFLGIAAFANDVVTVQGEWTVYTVNCQNGVWQGTQCTGNLIAGDRYRFRTLKAHREVMFWISGSSVPSGKFTDCEITDGRNWSCKPNADSPRTITHAIVRGRPKPEPDAGTRPFHCVSKWRWWFLKYGMPGGSSATS